MAGEPACDSARPVCILVEEGDGDAFVDAVVTTGPTRDTDAAAKRGARKSTIDEAPPPPPYASPPTFEGGLKWPGDDDSASSPAAQAASGERARGADIIVGGGCDPSLRELETSAWVVQTADSGGGGGGGGGGETASVIAVVEDEQPRIVDKETEGAANFSAGGGTAFENLTMSGDSLDSSAVLVAADQRKVTVMDDTIYSMRPTRPHDGNHREFDDVSGEGASVPLLGGRSGEGQAAPPLLEVTGGRPTLAGAVTPSLTEVDQTEAGPVEERTAEGGAREPAAPPTTTAGAAAGAKEGAVARVVLGIATTLGSDGEAVEASDRLAVTAGENRGDDEGMPAAYGGIGEGGSDVGDASESAAGPWAGARPFGIETETEPQAAIRPALAWSEYSTDSTAADSDRAGVEGFGDGGLVWDGVRGRAADNTWMKAESLRTPGTGAASREEQEVVAEEAVASLRMASPETVVMPVEEEGGDFVQDNLGTEAEESAHVLPDITAVQELEGADKHEELGKFETQTEVVVPGLIKLPSPESPCRSIVEETPEESAGCISAVALPPATPIMNRVLVASEPVAPGVTEVEAWGVSVVSAREEMVSNRQTPVEVDEAASTAAVPTSRLDAPIGKELAASSAGVMNVATTVTAVAPPPMSVVDPEEVATTAEVGTDAVAKLDADMVQPEAPSPVPFEFRRLEAVGEAVVKVGQGDFDDTTVGDEVCADFKEVPDAVKTPATSVEPVLQQAQPTAVSAEDTTVAVLVDVELEAGAATTTSPMDTTVSPTLEAEDGAHVTAEKGSPEESVTRTASAAAPEAVTVLATKVVDSTAAAAAIGTIASSNSDRRGEERPAVVVDIFSRSGGGSAWPGPDDGEDYPRITVQEAAAFMGSTAGRFASGSSWATATSAIADIDRTSAYFPTRSPRAIAAAATAGAAKRTPPRNGSRSLDVPHSLAAASAAVGSGGGSLGGTPFGSFSGCQVLLSPASDSFDGRRSRRVSSAVVFPQMLSVSDNNSNKHGARLYSSGSASSSGRVNVPSPAVVVDGRQSGSGVWGAGAGEPAHGSTHAVINAGGTARGDGGRKKGENDEPCRMEERDCHVATDVGEVVASANGKQGRPSFGEKSIASAETIEGEEEEEELAGRSRDRGRQGISLQQVPIVPDGVGGGDCGGGSSYGSEGDDDVDSVLSGSSSAAAVAAAAAEESIEEAAESSDLVVEGVIGQREALIIESEDGSQEEEKEKEGDRVDSFHDDPVLTASSGATGLLGNNTVGGEGRGGSLSIESDGGEARATSDGRGGRGGRGGGSSGRCCVLS